MTQQGKTIKKRPARSQVARESRLHRGTSHRGTSSDSSSDSSSNNSLNTSARDRIAELCDLVQAAGGAVRLYGHEVTAEDLRRVATEIVDDRLRRLSARVRTQLPPVLGDLPRGTGGV